MKVNTTIDDVSPLITYSAGWSAGTNSDQSLTQYYQSTYMMCSEAADHATFTFNGTGIWLYGARRSDHGLYNVTLDGVTTVHDGFAAGAGLYQQVLFGASDLTTGLHTITLINNRNSSTYSNLDLDFVIWEEEIGAGTDTLNNSTDDDNTAAFTYGPTVTAWSTVPLNISQSDESTGHTTISAGAYVTYTFTGSAVSIYGALGPQQGPYSVQLDGRPAANYTAANGQSYPQQLLYHATGLTNTTHTVQLNNMPARTRQALTIDYAVVTSIQAPIVTTTSTSALSTTSSTTGSTFSSSSSIDTSLPTQSTAPASDKKGISTGAAVAIAVGALAVLALLSFALMMYRRKQPKSDEADPDMMVVYPEPYSIGNQWYGRPERYIPPSQNMQDGYTPLTTGNSNGSSSAPLYPPSRGPYDQHDFATRQEHFPPPQVDGVSLFSGLAPAMPQQGVGRPRLDSSSTVHVYATELASTAPYGHGSTYSGAYSGVSNGSSRLPAHGHSVIGSDLNAPLPPIPPLPNRNSNPPLGLHQAPPLGPGLIPPRKGQVTLPPSATAEQQNEFRGVSQVDLQARRMNVEGREQDFGPIIMDDPLHVSQAPLPPNYAQATEAFKR